MKGRLYNPAVGRFLSPDILVQQPEMGMSYNRYSYCLNNSLKYTDPSGWSFTNPDWYQNMFNGDMYYRSDLHGEEDSGKIEGEGWSYFGENGVFGEDELTLAAQYNMPSKKNETNGEGFSLEISLKGAEAEGFMQDMGYEFMPTYQSELNVKYSNPPIGITPAPAKLAIAYRAIRHSENPHILEKSLIRLITIWSKTPKKSCNCKPIIPIFSTAIQPVCSFSANPIY